MEKLLIKKLPCNHCSHESKTGEEYYVHDVYSHMNSPSGANYSIGWIVGSQNAYNVLHGDLSKKVLPFTVDFESLNEYQKESYRSGNRIRNNGIYEIVET